MEALPGPRRRRRSDKTAGTAALSPLTASPASGSSHGAAGGSIASASEWGPRAPMREPLRVVLELGDAQLEEIARRAAALAQLDLRPPPPSPYFTIPEAAAYLRCKRQRVDDLLS